MNRNKIKVLVTDDSLFFRNILKNEISKDPLIEVVGVASDPIDAEEKIKRLNPDIVTLDVEMPKMDGITFLKKVMQENPRKIVLVSSLNINVFDALEAGAVDFVKKPDLSSNNEVKSFFFDLKSKIKIATLAKINYKCDRNKNVYNNKNKIDKNTSNKRVQKNTESIIKLNTLKDFTDKIIAIGASTGGTEATLKIIKDLPATFPSIVITQHMPAGFTKMYADRLNRLCNIKVKEAVNGDRLTVGLALVAPGDKQMRVYKDSKGFYVRCTTEDKVSGHCPSVDVLFESISKITNKNAIGIILTGMGKDGSDGLYKMRENKAYTIGQDKESCVVYGMPKVAYDIGAVKDQSPLEDIPKLIIHYLNK